AGGAAEGDAPIACAADRARAGATTGGGEIRVGADAGAQHDRTAHCGGDDLLLECELELHLVPFPWLSTAGRDRPAVYTSGPRWRTDALEADQFFPIPRL